jgi:hypothetical protein
MRWRGKFSKKADDCTDAGGRATQEQLPSLHVVNEHFFGKFNDARASEVIFQSFPSVQRPAKVPGSPFNLERYGRTHTISLNKFNTNSFIEICRKLRR